MKLFFNPCGFKKIWSRSFLFFSVIHIFVLSPVLLSGQITLNNSNFPVAGLTITRGYGFSSVDVLGNAGTNQNYDFSLMTPIYHDTIKYYDATGTPWTSFHPGATVANVQVGSTTISINYFSASGSAFTLSGITLIGDFGSGLDTAHANYAPEDTLVADTYSYGHTETEFASATFVNIAPLADLKITTTKNISVDGWGDLLTPLNYYGNILRVKYTEYKYDTIFYMGAPVDNSGDTLYYFKYFAQGERHPVITAYTDSAFNLQYFEYIFYPPVITGCTDSMAMNYNPLATLPDGNCVYCSGVSYSLSPDTIICQGNSVTLSVSGGTEWLWITGSVSPAISVSPAETTVYSVYVSNSPTCHSLGTITVTVDKPVTASFWTTQNVYNTGELIQFINLSEEASLYQWNLDDSINGTSTLEFPTHSYSVPGIKNIFLIAGNTCFSDSVTDSIEVLSPSLIHKLFSEEYIRIYPNPGMEFIILEGIPAETTGMEIFAIDILGRETVIRKKSPSTYEGSIKLNTSELSPGIYFIGVRLADFIIYKKWIKTDSGW